MITLLLVIVLVGVLVLVHEWGHFYSARVLGVKVEEFGIGFPPKIFSWVKDGIRYSLNALPFGGFVKIFGEQGEGEGDKDSFISRPVWQRFIILSAGVFMNLVLAWVFFSVGAYLGVPEIDNEERDGLPVSIISVMPGSPAEEAGLKFGDQILEMLRQGQNIKVVKESDVSDFTRLSLGQEVTLVIKRGKEINKVPVVSRSNIPEGEGPIGIALGRIGVEKTPFYLAPWRGLVTLFRTVDATIYGLGMILRELFIEGRTSVAVSGPVGIYFLSDDLRSLGSSFFIHFVGTLSVSLAILNFLPIPALDGGRVLFLAIEKIRGRRISPRFENALHTTGFVLLGLAMVLVTYRDIVRIL